MSQGSGEINLASKVVVVFYNSNQQRTYYIGDLCIVLFMLKRYNLKFLAKTEHLHYSRNSRGFYRL